MLGRPGFSTALALSALSLSFLCARQARAQPRAPDVEWERTFGGPCTEWATAVREADDGGFVAAGMTFVADDPLAVDLYLVKTDANGSLLWERTFGGPWIDQALDMERTSDGGFIVTGVTGGGQLCGADCVDSVWDVYLLRVDSEGREIWQRTFGGEGADAGRAVRETRDGGYIVAGLTNSFGGGFADVYLLRVDAEGALEWERTFGGDGHDRAFAVTETGDGGYIVAGRTAPRVGPDDVLVLRTDRSGNFVWQRTFGGPRYDLAYAVARTGRDEYVITGMSDRFDESGVLGVDQNVFLLKINGSGDLLWERTYLRPLLQTGHSLTETADGGWMIAASSSDGFMPRTYILKTDAEGGVIWETTLPGPGPNWSRSGGQTRDGGYIFAGRAELPEPRPRCTPFDLYLVKLGPEPGASTTFLRGDTDRDDRVELSDAVSILASLFLGTDAISCDDAADADDDGVVEINDAIYLLTYLFRGGRAPAPPFPGPGVDPTADRLGC